MQPIRFPARGGFHETVKQRVEQYFADSRWSTTGDWRLFVKTGVILAWFAGSYALLVFGSTSLLVTMLAVCALAQGCALVGFNIMHDGAHESYAHSKTINWLMGGMLNVIGGSQTASLSVRSWAILATRSSCPYACIRGSMCSWPSWACICSSG